MCVPADAAVARSRVSEFFLDPEYELESLNPNALSSLSQRAQAYSIFLAGMWCFTYFPIGSSYLQRSKKNSNLSLFLFHSRKCARFYPKYLRFYSSSIHQVGTLSFKSLFTRARATSLATAAAGGFAFDR